MLGVPARLCAGCGRHLGHRGAEAEEGQGARQGEGSRGAREREGERDEAPGQRNASIHAARPPASRPPDKCACRYDRLCVRLRGRPGGREGGANASTGACVKGP